MFSGEDRIAFLRRHKALVTGASRGIGKEVVRQLVDLDFDVVAVGRSFGDMELWNHPRVTVRVQDLAHTESLPDLLDSGPFSLLVNNAGVMHPNTWVDYDDELREHSLRVNLKAPVELMRLCAPAMIEAGGGSIVNVASIAGMIGHPDIWYGVTKAGLLNATRSFALRLGGHNITVNAVAPGPVETDMLSVIPPARQEALLRSAVTGRFSTPQEVAAAILQMAFVPVQIQGCTLDICAGAIMR